MNDGDPSGTARFSRGIAIEEFLKHLGVNNPEQHAAWIRGEAARGSMAERCGSGQL